MSIWIDEIIVKTIIKEEKCQTHKQTKQTDDT